MSNRSIRKRRHRPDFQEYMDKRKMVKQAGFSSITSYDLVMAKLAELKAKQPEVQPIQTVALEEAPAHVHGPECNHDHE